MANEKLLTNYNIVLDNIKLIKSKYNIENSVKIAAVTKYSDIDTVKEFISLGLNTPLAESKAQSLRERAILFENVAWHFIGHIQTNKIKYIVPHASLIQSVDSLDVLSGIENEAKKIAKIQEVLIQVNISYENQKSGVDFENVRELFDYASELKNVNIIGVMGMATYTEDLTKIEREFESLRELFCNLKQEYKNFNLKEISMGMSGDYELAVKHGSTMVRIGSSLFN